SEKRSEVSISVSELAEADDEERFSSWVLAPDSESSFSMEGSVVSADDSVPIIDETLSSISVVAQAVSVSADAMNTVIKATVILSLLSIFVSLTLFGLDAL
ncbi:MAG: hypothetical protein IKQ24_10830, partial [Verrucomicrobia bacterium]|nr:hypothetical protein [Verrucomicrobiota bacterium]